VTNAPRTPATTSFERHWPQALALFVLAVALWAQSSALVGVFYDDGIYVTLAKALAEGEGYRSIHLPGAPPAVHYPPLYSAVLATLWKLWPSFPQNVALFKLFDAAVLAGAAWVIATHARHLRLPAVARYVTLVMGMTAFPLLTLVGVRFSEPLFLLLLAGAVATADVDRVTTKRALAAGLLAGLATLTRSIGVAAIVGIPAVLWFRRQRRAALVALVIGVALAAPWAVWTTVHGESIDPRLMANYGTYGQYARLAGLGGLLAGLDLRALGPFSRLLIRGLPWALWIPIAAILVLVVLTGAWTALRRTPVLIAVLVPYVGIVTLWPFTPDRFMWILLPWVGLLGVLGALRLWEWGRAGKVAVVLLSAAVLFGFVRLQALSVIERRFAVTAQRSSRPFELLTRGIATGTPEDAVIASDGEATVFLYTGRRTVPLFLFRLRGRAIENLGADTTLAYLCESGVTHVATSWVGGDAVPLFEAFEARSDSTLDPLFVVTDGPGLFRFQCPS
jgi:hypothetical protein